MKKAPWILILSLPVLLCSCSTDAPPTVFHNTDEACLVVESLDNRSARVLAPAALPPLADGQVLDQIKSLGPYRTAAVILEEYSEAQPGPQFRDRTFGWFLGLRGLGYQHIVFLQGKGVGKPEGLLVLAEYY
jgi:hypothetical protein